MPRPELPTGEVKTQRVRQMFDAIAPRYEFVNHLLTFGMDRRWRRRAVAHLALPPASRVVDVASGTGDFCRELSNQGYLPFGTDLSFGMLDAGGDFAPRTQANGAHLPFRDGSFDGLTCGYALRNFTELEATFLEMARVVRPGGRIVLLEVAEPKSGLWRLGFRVWFRHVVPLIGSIFSDAAAYRYLPQSTAYLPTSEELITMLTRSGFSTVQHRLILGGLSQEFVATRAA